MEIISLEKAAGSAYYRDTMKLTYKSGYDGRQDWAMLEKSTGKTAKTWVIILHGHGSGGDQIYTRKDVATTWLPALRERGLSILSPNLRGNAWMCKAAVEDLHALIEYVRWKLDAEKLIILSGSMGGTGALIYSANHPEDIAGVCALCPATDIAHYWKFCAENGAKKAILREIGSAIEKAYGGTPPAAPGAYEDNSALARAGRFDMPVFLVHGDNDAIIPVEESRTFVNALEKNKKKYTYTEMKNGHHDSPITEAVRGLDWILKENPALAVADNILIDADTGRTNSVYRCGEKALYRFTIQKSAAVPESGQGVLTWAFDSGKVITNQNFTWTSGTPVEVSGTLDEPGFLRLSARFDFPGDNSPLWKHPSAFRVAGFDPEKIRPAAECPADFRSFWEEGMKKLGKPEVKLEKIDKFSSPLITAWLLSFPIPGGKMMYGYLTIPNEKKKFPAIARVCDGGAGAASPWISRPDAIGLTLLVHNFPPAFDNAEMNRRYEDYNKAHGGPWWHLKHGIPDREKYYYRDVILGANYAIDYLATRPEWNGSNLVINGSSQGGMFSLYMAGLNTNVTAAIATVPSFCDLLNGHWSSLIMEPREASVAMLKYYDAVNFARFIRCPIVVGVGLLDSSSNPGGVYAAYNAIEAPKKIIACPLQGHGQLTQEYRDYTERWLNGQLGISAPLPPCGQ